MRMSEFTIYVQELEHELSVRGLNPEIVIVRDVGDKLAFETDIGVETLEIKQGGANVTVVGIGEKSVFVDTEDREPDECGHMKIVPGTGGLR